MTVEAMNYIQPSKAVLSPLAYTEDRVKRDEVYDERPQLQRFKDENAWLPVHEENSVVEACRVSIRVDLQQVQPIHRELAAESRCYGHGPPAEVVAEQDLVPVTVSECMVCAGARNTMNELHDPVIGKSLKIIPKMAGASSPPFASPVKRGTTASPTLGVSQDRSTLYTAPGGVQWKLPVVVGRSAIRTYRSDVTGRNSTELLHDEGKERVLHRQTSLSFCQNWFKN
ncbi:hypothetical protein GUITHDRAFT_113676 [Guillardia theta CCMP2712]|uniref:Uncharacterized protein n=1 Tax=Guillardia theta (strain CCMP2712) TaxID=905079 RepID=L1IVA8_GUITC|nr:hypothetical protein GUITHDRAFT_113676 [Guillardia theta CCMP2712]EKX40196.1 hypothetical protein GUITHDRAFT_113676 [Guillardia theta CCMP2712]|eukprot:XP_005827176.1 hypothetical protein GUITHDRAFT_113676 [Guillardia theta CCMP2712]